MPSRVEGVFGTRATTTMLAFSTRSRSVGVLPLRMSIAVFGFTRFFFAPENPRETENFNNMCSLSMWARCLCRGVLLTSGGDKTTATFCPWENIAENLSNAVLGNCTPPWDT